MADGTASKEELLDRERVFHDDWADSIDPTQVLVRESFEGCTSPECAWLVKNLGDIRGLKVLELGSGGGEGAVYFAIQGAKVTATDLSPGMLRVVKDVAALHNVSVNTAVCSADDLSQFPDGSFDIVYAANLLHHVDIDRTLQEAKRVLAPNGRAAFWDPVEHNPAISVYRRKAVAVRTPDEHPIRIRDMATFKKHFGRLEKRFFWFTALLVFVKFYAVDRVDPSSDRYWKMIITQEKQLRPWVKPLFALDRLILTILPFAGWWCWNVAIVAHKQDGR